MGGGSCGRSVDDSGVGGGGALKHGGFGYNVGGGTLSPPFSEHLMRDYGAMNLALGLVTAVAALTMDRVMVRTSLAAYLLFAVPHLLFHVTHHDHYTASQAVGETTALAIAVLIPLGLLVLSWRVPSPKPLTDRI